MILNIISECQMRYSTKCMSLLIVSYFIQKQDTMHRKTITSQLDTKYSYEN